MSALAELGRPVADVVWLVQIDAARLDGGDDDTPAAPALVVETLTVASRPFVTDAVLDHPPATPIEGRFSPSFSISWELSASADTGFSSMPAFTIGQLEIENTDGALDGWLDLYAVQGREVRVSVAAWTDVAGRPSVPGGDLFGWLDAGITTAWTDSTPGGAAQVLWRDTTGRGRVGGSGLSAFSRLFKGRVKSWSFSGGRIVVLVDPDARRLDNPVQTTTYDGTGDLGGTTEMAGRTKPRALGVRKGIEPVLIDPVLLIYQVNDGPIHGVSDVRDVGISLAFVKDYDSYALLKAAVQQSLIDDQASYDIGIGQFVTCLAEGAFRLGGPAAGRVVCDVQGSSFARKGQIPWKSGNNWASGHGWLTLVFQAVVEIPWASGNFWASGHGWKAKGAPPYFSGARHMAQRLLVDDSGFDDTEVDSEGIDHLNGRDPDGSLDPSSGLWFPPGGSATGRDSLSRLFQSAGVVGFEDRDGVWRVEYLEIPPGPADIVLNESMLVPGSLERMDLSWPAPWSSWKAAWDRNNTPMTASDLAGGDQTVTFVDPNIRAFSLRPTAYAQADDASLALLYPQKRVGTLETELSDETDAELRAAQMLALYGGGQALYRAKWEGVMGKIGFMKPVTVQVPRLGMRNGRTFLVVGLTETAPDRRTETILYGGGDATVARPVPAVRLAGAPATVAVSATAVVAASFDIALAAAGDRDAVVLWTLGGLAAADVQTGLSGPLTIPAGQTSASVPVVFAPQALAGDKLATFTIRPLRGAAAGAPLSASFTLLANTAPTPAAFISSGFGSVMPSAAATVNASAVVSLSAAAASPASVIWTVTGLLSSDVVGALSGTAVVPAGQTSATIPFTFAAQVLVSDKAATLTISAPLGCTLGSPSAVGFTLLSNVTVADPRFILDAPYGSRWAVQEDNANASVTQITGGVTEAGGGFGA